MTREEAIQVLANFYVSTKNPKANHLCEAVYIAIQALKSEPKHGRWIKSKKSDYHWECSNCGYGLTDYRTTYCYDCGARMDEVEE